MQRDKFIKTMGLACVGLGLADLLLSSCANIHYVKSNIENNRILLKKNDFIMTVNNQTNFRKWVLVKVDKIPFPIGVFRFDDDTYSALYLECTHQGCELNPQADYLQCPCHGAEFSNLGKVLQPPAEKDLKKFPIETDQNNLYILLK